MADPKTIIIILAIIIGGILVMKADLIPFTIFTEATVSNTFKFIDSKTGSEFLVEGSSIALDSTGTRGDCGFERRLERTRDCSQANACNLDAMNLPPSPVADYLTQKELYDKYLNEK